MRSDDRVTTFVERCRSLSVRSGFRSDFPQQHAVIDNRVPLSKKRAAFRIRILLCETGESIAWPDPGERDGVDRGIDWSITEASGDGARPDAA